MIETRKTDRKKDEQKKRRTGINKGRPKEPKEETLQRNKQT